MQPPLVRVLPVVAVAGLLAVAASLPVAAQAEPSASRADLLQQGEQLLGQKQYRRALAAFEEAG
ncbi:MAG TPA: hypothetical protein VOA87_15660, partial [Thermoanaerobaculia bacterium]|nr:hypothetical protein [Thermoanaerobaculia bacterium]